MMLLSKWFGVTTCDAERFLDAEAGYADEIVHHVLKMQADSAATQQRPLCRGTHAKGVSARAVLEVPDVTAGRDPALGARLARGVFARPGAYPAIVRFANSDPHVNSDLKPDVRALSFSVDLTKGGREARPDGVGRQDFTLQNATTLPLNDARTFLATMKVLTASNPLKAMVSLPFHDKARVLRTLALARAQARRPDKPYQQLRYWSTVPFRHGAADVVKQAATPSPDNPGWPLEKQRPTALQDELIRHLTEDDTMSRFDIGMQFLDIDRMTYWGKRHDADFWIENASVEWKEAEAPFHTVAHLVLKPQSTLSPAQNEAVYFDVTRNALPDSMPVGSINRARCPSEIASRERRMRGRGESR